MISFDLREPWMNELFWHLSWIILALVLAAILYFIIKYRDRLTEVIEGRYTKILVIIILTYTVVGIYYVFFGQLNYDEGRFIYASNQVYEGKLPYIDFLFGQPPLLPYIYGIPQLLFGSSMYVGRFTSLFFGILTLVITAKVTERFGGKIAAVAALGTICFNPYIIYLLTYSKSYVLMAFFMVLSVYFLFNNSNLRSPTRSVLSVLFMSMAVGVRASALPALLFLISYIIYTERRNLRTVFANLGAAAAALGVMFIPFLVINKDVVLFTLLPFEARTRFSGYAWGVNNAVFTFFNVLNLYFIVSALMFVVGIILLLYRQRYPNHLKFLYILACIVFAFHFAAIETIPEYQVVIVPLAAIIAGFGFSELYSNAKDIFIKYNLLLLTTTVILLILIAHGTQWVDMSGNKLPIEEIDEMADHIRNNTPKDGKILAFSIYLAVEADRKLLPGFSDAYYTYWPDWSTEKAREYNVVNKDILQQYVISQNASAILLTDFEKNVIGIEQVSLIEQYYEIVKTMPAWGQHVSTAYLYFPKTVAVAIQELRTNYGDTQTWTAKLPPNSSYVISLRSLASPVVIVVGSGSADANGEASGSFGIGNNLPSGSVVLRVELTSNPSAFQERTFIIGEPPGSITMAAQKSRISYGDTQTWTASGFAPHERYLVTVRSPTSPAILVIGSGNADANGNASGSFGVGPNIPVGDNILRVEVETLSSFYAETTFKIE